MKVLFIPEEQMISGGDWSSGRIRFLQKQENTLCFIFPGVWSVGRLDRLLRGGFSVSNNSSNIYMFEPDFLSGFNIRNK